MATIKPFAALRPSPESASSICELPYDVMSSDEARALAAGDDLVQRVADRAFGRAEQRGGVRSVVHAPSARTVQLSGSRVRRPLMATSS